MISCSKTPSWKRDIVSQERIEETGRRLKKREKEWSGRSQERGLLFPDQAGKLDKQLQQKRKERAEGPLSLPEKVPAQMDEDEDADNDGLTDPLLFFPSISYGSPI